MRVLVTGSDGFVGRHLGRTLRAAGHEVVEPPGPGVPDGLDVTDPARVRAILEAAKADAVIHLAAVSSVAESHRDPTRTFAVNALGTVNLLSAVKAVRPKTRVLVVSSGEVYGRAFQLGPAAEETPLAPLSPYAASKASAEMAALQFQRSYGTDVLCVRPFGHLGAGQATTFVVPSLAAQIAAIGRGEAEPVLRTGDLSPIRDFLHVTDVVAAYELLLREGVPGAVYNVASGLGRTVRSLLDELLTLASVSARIEVDPDRIRPVEIPAMIGDSARLCALGWVARRDVRTALTDVLEEHGAL
jgi:GDP-4-dehydro-6-deoxy-D-mannose reductase